MPFEHRTKDGAATNDTWATLLEKEGNVTAPHGTDDFDLPNQSTLLKCPSGVMETWDWQLPASHEDPTGAEAYPGQSSGPDHNANTEDDYVVHTWYGANAATFYHGLYPMARQPSDDGNKWDVLHRMGEFDRPANLVGLFDGVWSHNDWGYERINARHMNATRTNLMLLDGHAEGIDAEDLPIGNLRYRDSYPPDVHWPTWGYDSKGVAFP